MSNQNETQNRAKPDSQPGETFELLKSLNLAAESFSADRLTAPALLANPFSLLSWVAEREAFREASARKFATPIPAFCMFSLTWRCNLRCKGCYAANYARRGDLPLETIERVMREATELGTYIFILVGGEPLLVSGLPERLAAIPKALFFLFTNGTLLSEAVAAKLAGTGNVVPMLSVDGAQDATDARRGAGVYLRLNEAMRILRGAKMFFGVSSVVTHQNVAEITSRAWFDKLWDSGVRLATLIDYLPFPNNAEPELVLRPEDIALKNAAVAKRYREARPFVVNFPAHEYASGDCGAGGSGFIHINADGFVEPCPFSHFASDNIREKPLIEALHSPFMSGIRECAKKWSKDCSGQCALFTRQEDVKRLAARTHAFATEALSA